MPVDRSDEFRGLRARRRMVHRVQFLPSWESAANSIDETTSLIDVISSAWTTEVLDMLHKVRSKRAVALKIQPLYWKHSSSPLSEIGPNQSLAMKLTPSWYTYYPKRSWTLTQVQIADHDGHKSDMLFCQWSTPMCFEFDRICDIVSMSFVARFCFWNPGEHEAPHAFDWTSMDNAEMTTYRRRCCFFSHFWLGTHQEECGFSYDLIGRSSRYTSLTSMHPVLTCKV